MTIHDELILALTQPNEKGDVPIYKMVGRNNAPFRIEESAFLSQGDRPDYTAPLPPQGITPDIIVRVRTSPVEEWVAIEVETDKDFDFGESLRQVKKYRGKYGVIVVIPMEYERFVPLYKNEGLRVYLWKATRILECMACGKLSYVDKPIEPKCSAKGCKSPGQRLKGIKDEKFVEA
jgi:hypothetical protein